jgi:hypothetical protein
MDRGFMTLGLLRFAAFGTRRLMAAAKRPCRVGLHSASIWALTKGGALVITRLSLGRRL